MRSGCPSSFAANAATVRAGRGSVTGVTGPPAFDVSETRRRLTVAAEGVCESVRLVRLVRLRLILAAVVDRARGAAHQQQRVGGLHALEQIRGVGRAEHSLFVGAALEDELLALARALQQIVGELQQLDLVRVEIGGVHEVGGLGLAQAALAAEPVVHAHRPRTRTVVATSRERGEQCGPRTDRERHFSKS